MDFAQIGNYRFRAIFLISFLGFISLGIQASLLGAAWPAIRESFGLSLDAVGILLSLGMFGSILTSLSIGRIARVLRIRSILVTGTAILGLGLFGYAVSSSWWQMIVAAFMTGVGGAAYLNGANTFFSREHGVRRLNWLHASFGIGAVLSPLIMAALLAAGQSWRCGYGFAGMLFITISIGFLIIFSQRSVVGRSQPSPSSKSTQKTSAKGSGLRNVNFSLLFFGVSIFFLYTGVEVTAGQWIFSLLTEERDVHLLLAGMLNSMFWGGLAMGRIIMGLLSVRFKPQILVRYGLSGAIISCFLLLFRSVPVNMVGLVGLGFSLSPVYPTLAAQTQDRFGTILTPQIIGLETAAASLGIAFWPGLAGYIAERSTLEIVGPFLVTLAITLFFFHERLIQLSGQKSVPTTSTF